MRPNNGRLVALVAAVAVAAVAVGGALAYRQGPRDATAEAAPLPPSPAPSTSATPSSTTTTPTPTATPKPSSAPPTASGPLKITVTVGKLDKGREPQIPYLVGREVRGGAGTPTKIPGTGGILAIGRLNTGVLAVVAQGEDTELLKIYNEKVTRTPGVTSLVTTADQSAAAYAAARISSLGAAKQGGVVYAETAAGGGSMESLKLPDSWNLQVLAYVDGTVYYRADDDDAGAPWSLYSWVPGAKPTLVKTVSSPSAVSADGQVAAAVNLINDSGSCSSVSEISSGKRLSRTCDYMITGFTPDGATAIGGPAYGDGYCNTVEAAVDTKTGRLIREWKGCFHQIVAEDDQHVLMVAVAEGGGGDPGTKSAIIRCTITTGACERATTISTDQQLALAE